MASMRRAGTNRNTRPRPLLFALNNARSALPTNSSASCACVGASATPQLAATRTSLSSTLIGCAMAASTASATCIAVAASVTFARSIANSSPPIRATRSSLLTSCDKRLATSHKMASPRVWPSVSLTSLNPSRSIISTVAGAGLINISSTLR